VRKRSARTFAAASFRVRHCAAGEDVRWEAARMAARRAATKALPLVSDPQGVRPKSARPSAAGSEADLADVLLGLGALVSLATEAEEASPLAADSRPAEQRHLDGSHAPLRAMVI